ncbi:MAG: hypothetical protein AVDCRST_MAG18-3809, partial [uncultured Thermomicrobiales bacterium]
WVWKRRRAYSRSSSSRTWTERFIESAVLRLARGRSRC